MLLSAMDQQGFELVGSIDMSVGSSGGENSSGTSERESSLSRMLTILRSRLLVLCEQGVDCEHSIYASRSYL